MGLSNEVHLYLPLASTALIHGDQVLLEKEFLGHGIPWLPAH